MSAFGPLFLDNEAVHLLLRDADGNMRAALICWGVAVSAFVVLRAPRQVLLACLFAATVTVGFAALLADVATVQATASTVKSSPSPASYRGVPPKPAARNSERLP